MANHVATMVLIALTMTVALCTASARGVDGPTVLEGLEVSASEVRDLEAGEVITLDSEPYENTPRELAADAFVLVHSSMRDLLEAFEENTSLIPVDDTLAHAEIFGEADFDGVEYTDEEYDEVSRLISPEAQVLTRADLFFSERRYGC